MLEDKREEVFTQIVLDREEELVKKANCLYSILDNIERRGAKFSSDFDVALAKEVNVIGDEVRKKIISILLGKEKAFELSDKECLKFLISITAIRIS